MKAAEPKSGNRLPPRRQAGRQPGGAKLMDTVFEIGEADWRGIGIVPASGLRFKKQYERFDAAKTFRY